MEPEHLLGKLKMDHLEAQLDAGCEQAAQRKADYRTFLVQALQTEWQGRYQRGMELRLRQARFPWLKTLGNSTSTSNPAWIGARCSSWPASRRTPGRCEFRGAGA